MRVTEGFVIRILLALLLIAAFCPVAAAAPNKKIDFLLRFYDLNEAAFAYHRHCLSSEVIDAKFLSALEFVADELFSELQKNEPDLKPEYLKNRILERRYDIQYALDRANIKDGCYSAASMGAKQHYQEFSHYKQSEIRQFIDEETRKISN